MLRHILGTTRGLKKGSFPGRQTLQLLNNDSACSGSRPSFAASSGLTQSVENESNTSSSSQLTSNEDKPKKAELLAAFTCNKCGGRTGVAFSKVAYERGVVIARCSKCDVQHLISDQLGWFGEKGNIEDILRQKGQDIRKSQANGVLALSPEDVEAWSAKANKQQKEDVEDLR